MLFSEYKSDFEKRKALVRLPLGVTHLGGECRVAARPAMPPWGVDWAILYPDGMHIRVKEYYRPMAHPNYSHGERKHFRFQYGSTSVTDEKGMPRTQSIRDTVIRIDRDQWERPHLHYAGKDHIYQEDLEGTFVINNVSLFEFIDAVETHRQSNKCPFEEILLFKLRGAKQ